MWPVQVNGLWERMCPEHSWESGETIGVCSTYQVTFGNWHANSEDPLVLLCLLPFTNTEKSISFHFSMEWFKWYHYQVETPFLVYCTNSWSVVELTLIVAWMLMGQTRVIIHFMFTICGPTVELKTDVPFFWARYRKPVVVTHMIMLVSSAVFVAQLFNRNLLIQPCLLGM